MAFYRVPTEFLLAILCALMMLHACTAHLRGSQVRFHDVCTALTACRWRNDMYANITQTSPYVLYPKFHLFI